VVVPVLGLEPFAVGSGAFAAGEDDEVGAGFGLVGPMIALRSGRFAEYSGTNRSD